MMSVILETTFGDLVIDLYTDRCPQATKNFLKLCKTKYYNNCLFHNIQKDYIVQTGDPTGTGRGGGSIYGMLYGPQADYFEDEIQKESKFDKIGLVAMANKGPNLNGSQFFITTGENLTALNGKHTIFGEVAEGFDTLNKLNNTFITKDGKPLQVIRIRHTIVLQDTFDDPEGIKEKIPDRSPSPTLDAPEGILPEDADLDSYQKKDIEEITEELEKREAQSRAEVLTILQDLPHEEIKPPENVLFICKLNPATKEEDLELIFSRFGKVLGCEIIKDHKTGDSLCYGFVEYGKQEEAELAYAKMNNILIDDRRIKVDFSQSVAKVVMHKYGGWRRYMEHQNQKHGTNIAIPPPVDLKESIKPKRDDKYRMVFEDEDYHAAQKRKRTDRDRSTDQKRSRKSRDKHRHRDDRSKHKSEHKR